MRHFYANEKVEIDMSLNADKGKLDFCVVGIKETDKQAKLWNLPVDDHNGWVPHFNLYARDNSVKIACIPSSWYGIEQSDIFDE